jgi:outer membrane phospholipase A
MIFFLRLAKTSARAGGRILLLLMMLEVTTAAARAQDDTPVLVSPSQPLTAGRPGSLWLYCVNSSASAVSRTFEPTLAGTLTATAGSAPTVLRLNPSPDGTTAVIRPGGFVREEYRWEVPAALSGSVTLTVSNYNPVLVRVIQSPAAAPGPVPLAATPPTTLPTNAAARSAYLEYLGQHLSPYEPIYFILGTYPAAEFQLSLKYKLFNVTNDFNPLGHLYFAYTQTSYWDLISSDPSFYDTSYKPSAFFLYRDVVDENWIHLDLQPGFEHESNGKGGADERSLYTAYVQPTATIDLPRDWKFRLQPRAWSYVDVGQNNPDIADYRGYADLLTDLTWTDAKSLERIQLAAKVRLGDAGDHAGLWFDLRFNLAGAPFLSKFNPAIQVEYFTGYGQTLRQYNVSSHGLRAGLCLWY